MTPNEQLKQLQDENRELVKYLELALSFAPKGEVPKGLLPTAYFTLNYEEDCVIQNKIDEARNFLSKYKELK